MKMINAIMSFAVVASMAGCVEDLSTTGDEFMENDNTYAPAKIRNIMEIGRAHV